MAPVRTLGWCLVAIMASMLLATACGTYDPRFVFEDSEPTEAERIAIYGTLKEMKAFAVDGGNVNETKWWGTTAVNQSVGMRNDMLALLLDLGADPNIRDRAGMAAIHTAVIRKAPEPERVESVRLLLAAGADTSVEGTGGPWNGKTPCQIARDQSDHELAGLLC